MHDYDIYLFDWDGTLVNSMPVWIRIVRKHLDAVGVHPTEDELIRAMGDWKNVKALGLDDTQMTQFRAAVGQEVIEHLPAVPLFDGAHDALRRLKQNKKKLAVVTATHRHIIDMLLEHHGYDQLFDIVISGDDVQNQKPHPEALLLALDKLKRRPGETVLMLGDADRDIRAAHQAGVKSLLYYPPEHQTLHNLEELRAHNPTHIIRHWKGLGV